jgi:hypothetical protein
MDETLLAAFLATDYRVRLPTGGWASIRTNAALPERLRSAVDSYPWAFITAWNPHSQMQVRAKNHAAQHDLLARLKKIPETVSIRPGLGVGLTGWREPSWFVVGPSPAQLDPLAHRYRQSAYVHGYFDGLAILRWSH